MDISQYMGYAKTVLEKVYHQDWMDSNDWEDFEDRFFSKTGCTYEHIAGFIAEGVQSGFYPEGQAALLIQSIKCQQIYPDKKF